MARRFSDPVQARQISEVTMLAIQDMRACSSPDQVIARHREWQAFADGMDVVKPIRDHVSSVVTELLVTMKAKRTLREQGVVA